MTEATWTSWKHSQSNAFFFIFFLNPLFLFWNLFVWNFTRCFTAPPPQRVRRVIYDWTVLEVQTQEHRSLEQTDQWFALENSDESLETSNNSFQNCPMCGISCQCQDLHAILLKFQPARINWTLHLMLQGPTMLNGLPRGSSMISTCCVRVVSSEKWRLMNLGWGYGYHWIIKQIWEQVSIGHQN